jgi:hypothetical protein
VPLQPCRKYSAHFRSTPILIWIMGSSGQTARLQAIQPGKTVMTKPIPDKAEVALEYPDKLYIGTFERSAQFEAHLDKTGISLTLQRSGGADARRSIRMHLHYGLFAEILHELANTVSAMPEDDLDHRSMLRKAAKALYGALARPGHPSRAAHKHKPAGKGETDTSTLSPEEEVLLLHVLE